MKLVDGPLNWAINSKMTKDKKMRMLQFKDPIHTHTLKQSQILYQKLLCVSPVELSDKRCPLHHYKVHSQCCYIGAFRFPHSNYL